MRSSSLPVVLVDDESSVLLSSKMILASAGIRDVKTIDDSRQLMPLLSREEVGVVVLDLFMPYLSGSQLLSELVREYPEIPVIVMTAAQEVETAVSSMKGGAFDYLVKPVEESRFVSSVGRALEQRVLRKQLTVLKHYLTSDQLEHGESFQRIVTISRKMMALFHYLEAIAGSNEPVLITGETGVGKELLADAVHRSSGRAGEFVAVNVAGLDDSLFSDTLFGHKKGAYSGADSAREGLVAAAAGGTLFLDEIGNLKAASQVKLLRLLQERQYYPLGSDVAKMSDVRVVCATNSDLDARMSKGKFRSDLYYRLSVHQVEIPPLRERKEDLPALTLHFIEEASRSLDRGVAKAPHELFTLLANYHFPGNVRELRAMVIDAVASCKSGSTLSMKSFRKTIKATRAGSPKKRGKPGQTSSAGAPFPTLKEAEQLHVEEALRRAEGNQGVAATLLGISRPALNRRLARARKDSS